MLESEDFCLGHSLAAMNSRTGLDYILGEGGGMIGSGWAVQYTGDNKMAHPP